MEFYLFSSHIPCGDASIILKDVTLENNVASDHNICNILSTTKDLPKRKEGEIAEVEPSGSYKKQKTSKSVDGFSSFTNMDGGKHVECLNDDQFLGAVIENCDDKTRDVYRTGAKCVSSDSRQDLRTKGVDYHTVGAVRTKPGRGDPTLSVSCSDKMARWNSVGMQVCFFIQL